MKKKHRLSFRIIFRVLLITITLFVLIISGYYYYTSKIIREHARNHAIQIGENLAGDIDLLLLPIEKIPQMLATAIEMDLYDENTLITILETVVKNNEEIYGACFAFEPNFFPEKGHYFMPYVYRDEEQIKSTFLGSDDYVYFYMDWYQIPKKIEKPYWTEPYFDEGGGNIIMSTYSVPFYKRNSEGERHFAGIATIDISLERLTEMVSEVKIFETGYAFMISGFGMVITHPDKNQIMNKSIFSNAEEWNAPMLREIGRELMQGKSKFRQYHIPGRSKQWIYYTNLNSNMWSVGVVYPDEEMFAELKLINIILASLIVLGLILLTFLTIRNVNRLVKPLSYFGDSARMVAEGKFDVKIPPVKNKGEIYELRQAFCNMQKQLGIYIEDLKKTTVAKEKIESELRIARDIQMSMIPHSFPPFPHLPQIDLFAKIESAKEVGGDLYDFFMIEENKFCFVIGDVSDKGVPASLFMAVTRTMLRAISDRHKTPAAILEVLNKALALNNDSFMFVTFFLGILNIKTGVLEYANAGHNPFIFIQKNKNPEYKKLEPGVVLAAFENSKFTNEQLTLNPNDVLFLYTDGVTEAMDINKELFGEDRLLEVIRKSASLSVSEIVEETMKEVEVFVKGYEQSDDITILALKFIDE